MSTKVTISPKKLRSLAQDLRNANKRNIEAIQRKVNAKLRRMQRVSLTKIGCGVAVASNHSQAHEEAVAGAGLTKSKIWNHRSHLLHLEKQC